jgi:hypothetical protein
MKILSLLSLFVLIICLNVKQSLAQDVMISDDTETCLGCHAYLHPGLVADWKNSLHAKISPLQALQKTEIERRISVKSYSNDTGEFVVGCYECHSLNADKHADNFEHYDYNINVVVTPNDCYTCHPVEVEQYTGSKKAHALGNLEKNPVYHSMVSDITSIKEVSGKDIVSIKNSENAKNESCYACHGTKVEVIGIKTIEVNGDELDVPILTNWPNQGVGRKNPDGSLGACTSCHPRHSFSIEIARKPYTCSQCHLQPDLPAWDVYKESKHGNIFNSIAKKWNWQTVPWKVGEDFTAPTCATCHNSLVTSPDEDIIAERTHDFGSRLWVRIFGLIYSHPQPKDGKTFLIQNSDGLHLPTTFDGKLASEYLIDENEQKIRQKQMENICQSCHNSQWAAGHFAKFDQTIKETDIMTKSATQFMKYAWENHLADNKNPFDEVLEKMWIKQWLFYANSTRYASAMSGPDYAGFKNGWWDLTENLKKIELYLKKQSK